MKKFLLLLLLIPAFASAQTTYWSPGVPPGSTPFSPTFRGKSTGTDSLTNLYISIGNKWFQVYTAAQSWGYFSRLFKGDIKDPLNPVTLSIGDSTATDFNNFAVFKNSNGDLVTPSINYSASTSTVTFNPKINANGGVVLNLPIGAGTSFVKVDGSGNGVRDTSHYISLSGLSVSGAPLHYNSGTGVFSIDAANTSQPGYLTSTDWNTFNGKQPAGNYITDITGDATASGPGSVALTLATVLGTPGTIGATNKALTLTVDGKGRITAMSQANISITESQVINLTGDLAAKQGTVSIGSFSNTGTSKGLTLVSNSLVLTGADGSNPGGISLSAQTMGSGVKTFTSDIVANGVIMGKGGGSVSSNVYISATTPYSGTTGGANVNVGTFGETILTTGSRNNNVGNFGLNTVSTGNDNNNIGASGLSQLLSGSRNTNIGTLGAAAIDTSSDNITIGYKTGLTLRHASKNVMIGNFSGPQTGTSNDITGAVYLGYGAGQAETGNNKLYIANTNTATPLIYGDFSADTLRVNGRMSVTVAPLYPNDVVRKRDADSLYAPISGGGYVPASRQITVNGVAHDLSADRSYTITTANTDTTSTGFAPKAALIPYQTKAQNIAAYQPIENQRVSTSNSVSFNNVTLIGTGGAGYYDMPSQSTSPVSASGHLRLYSDSVNRLSWKNSTYRRTIQVPYPSDYTIRMPYLVTGTTLEDSTHASSTYVPKTTTVAGFPLSGNVTLANLTAADATVTVSGAYNGSTARTIGLNLSNQNNFTAPQQVSINNSAATTSAGLELLNTNAATVGNQMFTPYMHFSSFGWGTTAGTSQQVEWRIHGDPVQGATPSAVLNFDSQINGGGWSNRASLSFGAFTAQSYTASFGSIATGTTSDALYANNNTASTSGTPNQYSPNMHWRGEVWNTTATAANNWADFTAQVQTTSGTTPTAKWTLNGSLTTTSTPSYTALFTVDNSGNAVHTGSVTATNFIGSGSTAFQSSGTSTGSDLLAMGTGGASQSTAQLQFLGSTAARSRVLERGSSTVTLASGDIYTGHVIGEQAVATAGSGTQAGIGAFAVRAPVITYNGATVTDAFNVLFQGAPANATGGSWNVYGKYGVSRFTGFQADSAFKIALAVPITITEGSGGRTGQTTLVSGTKAITISGITTSSRALVQLVTPTGVTLTTSYQAVCTSNTLTVQANVAAGTINTADGSTLNYFIVN